MHLDGFSDSRVFREPFFKVLASFVSCVPTETFDRWFVVNTSFLVILLSIFSTFSSRI